MTRKARAYKISDEDYSKAMERAGKEGQQLATLIETFVIKYAQYGTIQDKQDLTFRTIIESKTDKKLPGLTAGMKQVKVQSKEIYPENARFKIVNGKKVFK